MSVQDHMPIRQTNLYRRLVQLEDSIWFTVLNWDSFSKQTVGRQLTSAMDSIGANLCEGDGRYGGQDAIRFFFIARGSGEESKFWIERARVRALIADGVASAWLAELDELMKMLNGIIAYRRSAMHHVKEDHADYGASCDLTPKT